MTTCTTQSQIQSAYDTISKVQRGLGHDATDRDALRSKHTSIEAQVFTMNILFTFFFMNAERHHACSNSDVAITSKLQVATRVRFRVDESECLADCHQCACGVCRCVLVCVCVYGPASLSVH